MGQVVEFSKPSKAEPAKPANARTSKVPQYFCTRCNGDWFKLYENGIIHCGDCTALMRNIGVQETTK